MQISKAGGRVPVTSGARKCKAQEEIVLDVEAMINDFQLLGDGLVKSVQQLN